MKSTIYAAYVPYRMYIAALKPYLKYIYFFPSGTSDKIGMIERILAWLLHNNDAKKENLRNGPKLL